MFFGEIDTAGAAGAILAHSVKLDGKTFKKGRVLGAADVHTLLQADINKIVGARLEAHDVHEDAAAEQLGAVLGGAHVTTKAPFTGRVNLYADAPGVLCLEPHAVHMINSVHESITIATLPPWTWVKARQMIATIKVIPFAVARANLELTLAHAQAAPVSVSPMRARTAVLIQTTLPGMRASILDKTVRVLEARLGAIGIELTAERRVAHQVGATAAAVTALAADADMILIAGASAIVDRRDVVPSAIEAAGGEVVHFGMPVDPGNLILLARRNGKPVLGLPGCARSPALNGVDLVLQRIAAGLQVDSAAIMQMGVGGLLKEFSGRPTPRAGERTVEPVTAPKVAAVVLAAGQSRRMGAVNKLLVEVDGQAMVVTAVKQALASGFDSVVVVTGHESERVRTALAGLPVAFQHNPDFADGLSTSLVTGVRALTNDIDAAVVCLADMPRVTARVLERLVAAYDPVEGRAICVPTWHGKRGNPILWDRSFFAQIAEVAGDIGARHLLGEYQEQVCEVAMTDAAVVSDIDSPADLQALLAQDDASSAASASRGDEVKPS